MERREFMKSIFSAAMLSSSTSAAWADGSKKQKIARYKRLGKTRIQMSDISFGCASLPSAGMVLRAIDRGVNYFDVAPIYGRSEEVLGEAIEKHGQRDKIYITSKFGFYNHLLPWLHFNPYSGVIRNNSPKSHYIKAVEGSLKRLRTDYLDIVMIHGVGSSNGGKPGDDVKIFKNYEFQKNRMFDPRILEAADELKQAGKIRYLGVSSHGPYHMEQLLIDAVRSGYFDVILMAYNFLRHDELPNLIQELAKSDIGVIAMKTLARTTEEGAVVAKPGDYEAAALKYVLNQPFIDSLIVTMNKISHINQYLGASGKPYKDKDWRVLEKQATLHGRDYCRTGCSDCEASCPYGVQIADIMRQQMYFSGYGREKDALEGYARIGQNATACLTCYDTPCTLGCPHKLNIPEKMQAAHHNLVLT